MSLHQAIKSLIIGALVLGVSLGQHLWANEPTKIRLPTDRRNMKG